MKIIKPRNGSGVGITSVSCSTEWLKKMYTYNISPSAAFKRGLKFFFDEVENKEPQDSLRQKITKLTLRLDEVCKQLEQYKKMRGEL